VAIEQQVRDLCARTQSIDQSAGRLLAMFEALLKALTGEGEGRRNMIPPSEAHRIHWSTRGFGLMVVAYNLGFDAWPPMATLADRTLTRFSAADVQACFKKEPFRSSAIMTHVLIGSLPAAAHCLPFRWRDLRCGKRPSRLAGLSVW